MRKKTSYLFLFFIFLFSNSFAQKYTLHLNVEDSLQQEKLYQSKKIKRLLKPKQEFRSKSNLQKQLLYIQDYLTQKGFLQNSCDTLWNDSLTCKATFNVGKAYRWAQLTNGNIPKEIYHKNTLKNEALVKPKEFLKLKNNIITYYENNGHPFTQVYIDSAEISENRIKGILKMDKKKLIKIDSIEIKGNLKINSAFLYNYLEIKPGSPYNEKKLRAISTKINELAFAQEIKKPELAFYEKYSKLNLFLKSKKASELDGLVGFLPDDRTGKITFTGQAHMKIQNAFSYGEIIELDFRRLKEKTQDLKAHLNLPYILNAPVGTDLIFKIYKRDSTFIDINSNIGAQYFFQGMNFIKFFFENKQSNLINTKPYENYTTLPPFADVKINNYGINLKFEQLNYRLNPTKGVKTNITGSAGQKNIIKNSKLNPVVYENISLKSTQYRFESSTDVFIPLFKNAALNLGLDAAGIFGNSLFTNELYRIGGLRLLRGFDEESIYSNLYSIGTVEFKYVLDRNSYFYTFLDACYYENNSIAAIELNKKTIKDNPYGFGAGITFETKAGIFTINYALGKQFDNPISFRSAKVHFGFVSVF